MLYSSTFVGCKIINYFCLPNSNCAHKPINIFDKTSKIRLITLPPNRLFYVENEVIISLAPLV